MISRTCLQNSVRVDGLMRRWVLNVPVGRVIHKGVQDSTRIAHVIVKPTLF